MKEEVKEAILYYLREQLKNFLKELKYNAHAVTQINKESVNIRNAIDKVQLLIKELE